MAIQASNKLINSYDCLSERKIDRMTELLAILEETRLTSSCVIFDRHAKQSEKMVKISKRVLVNN